MIRRRYASILLVLSATMFSGEALAHFTIPATEGMPGDNTFVNKPTFAYWIWSGDVYVTRNTLINPAVPLSGSSLEWIIPLPFYEDLMRPNLWRVKVITNQDTLCSVWWYPGDLDGTGPVGTVQTSRARQGFTGSGLLELTIDGLCPGPPPTTPGQGCQINFSIAQVTCSVTVGGMVGPVIYYVNAAPVTPAPSPGP
jgi:hypothetical protein